MASPIVTATIQGAVISVISNILAQAITAHQTSTPLVIDWIPVFQYALFAAISTPPNFLWQEFLEGAFPAYHMAPTAEAVASAAASNDAELDDETRKGRIVEPRLNKRNTLIKTVLDQTVGAALNTLAFSMFVGGIRQGMRHHYDVAGAGKKGGWGFLLQGKDAVRYEQVRWDSVWESAKTEFWPLVKAGWRFWPMVSLINFVFLTSVQARSLVGSLAGLGWGVYISLVTAQ
ncbi:hypothetical protein N0V88_003763 [Collariella sp. IMI 366227]|nr:hypothetical protein N0V88_003763 [Collariella sp. IMI 366227]